ncbi:MAG TPA: DUF2844 domain-containing protein [Candidatus Binataceae bacterium]|nr:DUF2844 domain-containing protein [Candidatus Binataceae bacterium]
MKIVSICAGKLTLAVLLAGYFLAAAAIPARAGLGDDATSIESDAAAMQGTLSQAAPTAAAQPSASYRVKTFVTGNGTTVREYAAQSGTIFGVAWRGRRPPDLSRLFGSYYSEYSTAAANKRHSNLHHQVTVSPHMVVAMHGHMGHLVGRAYVPGLAPSDVDPKAVVQ